MREPSQSVFTPRRESSNLRADQLAGAQWGVIGWRQLAACGVSSATTSRWRAIGRLHRIHAGVFAYGHPFVPIEGRMVAALIRAGEGAALSHSTAAWWWGLIDDQPDVLEISVSRRIRGFDGVRVYQRRHVDATRHRRFPITTLPQTFLDLAARRTLATVRRALAEADYRGLLDADDVAATAGRGKPGAARLRKALKRHQPQLAHTRSRFERAFLSLCETAGIPLPEVNVRIGRWTVDALWRRQRVVVELDGYDNHRSRAQIDRDRRKELALRAAGFVVLRYTWPQVTEEPDLVVADLLATLLARAS